MTWTVNTVMATVSISFFHSKFGTDISSLFSERKKEKREVYLSAWKRKHSKWDMFLVCLRISAWHLDQVTRKGRQNER